MMYEVYLDDKLLYYPNDETYVIYNATLKLALSEAGSFEFDIPKINLRYDDFSLRKSMVQVLQNGEEIFYGEVREVTDNFNFTRHVYVVGELAFLFDSIQPQKLYTTTPYQMVKSLISQHNSQVEDRKKFAEIPKVITPDSTLTLTTNREDTLTVLRDNICSPLGLYIKIEKTGSTKTICCVPISNYGSYCTQSIEFGENLLDYSNNYSAQDIATCVIPLGIRLEDEERTSYAVDGLDEYLTIRGTAVDSYHKTKTADYLVNDEAVATFGYVRVVKEWDEITDAEVLKTTAIKWLKEAQYESMELEVKAIDGNLLDVDVDTFNLGDTVRVYAKPFGMDTTMPVRKKTIYLNNISKNEITLGSTTSSSFTKQTSDAVARLEDDLPEVSPILDSAKEKAMTLLNGSKGGHVIFKFDDTKTYIEQLLICNGENESISTERWVWNENGFGHQHRDSINDEWGEPSVAITIDGSIVAEAITSGTLNLGGNDSTVTLAIYNGSELIGRWDSTGLYAKKGTFEGELKGAKGTFNGDISGANGNFSGTINAGNINAGTLLNMKIEGENGNYVNLSSDGEGTAVLGDGAFQIGSSGTGYRVIIQRMDVQNVAIFNNTASFNSSVSFGGAVYVGGMSLSDYIHSVMGS